MIKSVTNFDEKREETLKRKEVGGKFELSSGLSASFLRKMIFFFKSSQHLAIYLKLTLSYEARIFDLNSHM